MTLNRTHLWSLLLATLLIRLLTLGAYPLMDTTEARYGEMARLMVETANWVTPQFDYGVPFWGKPPLFTWISAASIEVFGVNEFAVRMPHWLAGVFTLLLVGYLVKRVGYSGLIASIVVFSSGVFAVSAGAVMTDMALCFALTLAMIGFYLCWQEGDTKWGYLAFVGLALGLLAKGPLVIVLFGLGVTPWVVQQLGLFNGVKSLFTRAPVLTGSMLMLVIALPWYLLAEQASPGFLDYFIVGEHFKRFVVSGWEGDLYGTAHDEVRGTIWLFWLYAAAPWSIVLPIVLWKERAQWWGVNDTKANLVKYCLWWMVAPMLLFTLSGNILPAYVLPGIPAMGVIVAFLINPNKATWFKYVAAIAPILLLIATLVISLSVGERKSDKQLLSYAHQEAPIYYIGKRPFSGQFYSNGKAQKLTANTEPLTEPHLQIVSKPDDLTNWSQYIEYSCVESFHSRSGRSLFQCWKGQ